MLLIDAVYIHESGGKVLLEYLIRCLREKNLACILLLDDRFKSPEIERQDNISFIKVKASEKSRVSFYKILPEEISKIFCFANVPPPIKIIHAPVYIFFQNVLLLSSLLERNSYPVKQKLSFFFKQCYIRMENERNYQWVVQTPSMASKLNAVLRIPLESVSVIPFFSYTCLSTETSIHDPSKFVYVADGVPQKNHIRLLQAWEFLFDKYQHTPELHLTLPPRFTKLITHANRLSEKGLKIINHGYCDKKELDYLYNQCGYLIFPSLAESFGLPLIEAIRAGCGILAADLPYVHDTVKPSYLFDPYSVESIGEAVMRMTTKEITNPPSCLVSNQIEDLITLLL